MPIYLTSTEAATRLGVSRQTLYAYVSRGLLRAESDPASRESRYLAAEVARLAAERARGRNPKEVARAALDWGAPVLESGITLIEDGRLSYRGVDALDLAKHASLEDIAALLWQCDKNSAFASHAPQAPDIFNTLLEHYRGQRAEQALLPLFAVASEDAPTAIGQRNAASPMQGCGDLVRLLAACLLRTAPDTAPIHEQCARAWGVGEAGAELIRMALVLCADHELNASSFTARCIASTDASLRSVVIGGLAGLSGGRHGATTARGEALWDELGDIDPETRLHARLARGDDLPGFGHPLYPDGDVRAACLLARVLPDHPQWKTLMELGSTLIGAQPSLDLALVAVRRHLGLPVGAAFGLFALGRSVGWIAHALEQRENPHLIRPRAVYTGSRPAASDKQSNPANAPKRAPKRTHTGTRTGKTEADIQPGPDMFTTLFKII